MKAHQMSNIIHHKHTSNISASGTNSIFVKAEENDFTQRSNDHPSSHLWHPFLKPVTIKPN